MNKRLWNRKIKRAKKIQEAYAIRHFKGSWDLVECQTKRQQKRKNYVANVPNMNYRSFKELDKLVTKEAQSKEKFWQNSPHHKYLALAK